MIDIRFCYFLVFFSVVVGIHFDSYQGCGTNGSHNFFYGLRESPDTLLFMDIIQKDFKFFRRTSVSLMYPQKDDIRPVNISFVEAMDRRSDGSGGCVFLMDGGVGYDHVKLYLESKWNRGIDFVVRIYGFKTKPIYPV